MRKIPLFILLFFLTSFSYAKTNEIRVFDAENRPFILQKTAERIISLTPHLTENVFAAGAGNKLIAVVAFSDFPAEAKKIALIGSSTKLDLERIVALQPDLILAWEKGTSAHEIALLRKLGFNVFVSKTDAPEDIASELINIGKLAGTTPIAEQAAADYLKQLDFLRAQNAHQKPLRVFYEVWNAPLMSVGGTQMISHVISLCGGKNVFGKENALAPVISVEAVLAANPEVIVASGMDEKRPEWLDDWRRFLNLKAVQNNALVSIDPNHIFRHSPRLILGATKLCEAFAKARVKND